MGDPTASPPSPIPQAVEVALMRPEQMQQLRAERLIAVGRSLLAVSALVALWLDPSEPARYAATAYSLVAAYSAYSVLLAAAVWSFEAPRPRLALVTHAFDLVAFAVVLFFSEGATSPFFAFFVFALVSATLRWQARGTVWTAAAALALFLGIGLWSATFLPQEGFELNRFIIRSVYLAVVAALLAYLGLYEARLRGELGRLAAWPRHGARTVPERLGELVAQAADTLGMPHALLLSEEPEEPGPKVVSWTRGVGAEHGRVAPDSFEPPVPPPLARGSFLISDGGGKTVLRLAGGAVERWQGGAPIHPRLRARLGAGPILALALERQGDPDAEPTPRRDWLFLAGRRGMTSDDLLLGEIVAGIVSSQLEQLDTVDRLARAAAAEERVQLARDLHDGVIQSLTGAALRLETARLLVRRTPRDAEALLAETVDLLTVEQRELKDFIRGELPEGDLGRRLAELVGRSQRTWDIDVRLDWQPPRGAVPPAAAREVYRIVQEALGNAARHGGASRVEVSGRIRRSTPQPVLHLEIVDDGSGFPFAGRYDGDTLDRLGGVPKSIRQRVGRLGGSLIVESGDGGARLILELPLPVWSRQDDDTALAQQTTRSAPAPAPSSG